MWYTVSNSIQKEVVTIFNIKINKTKDKIISNTTISIITYIFVAKNNKKSLSNNATI